ncbi:rhamnogalacturonan acetylesterase [Sphingobacterium sp. LRF_L2]|uniref:rhamnogalacturonan acetylesterase n=1 Tax=Sphingobacterium sp. LRF_L2 TaxID=3369421 RepID=UPI003F641681
MNRHFSLLGASGLLLVMILCSFCWKARTTVWMMGDSTMAIKAKDKFPETGWGVAFATKFNDDVEVINKAKNGRSTKSFINEGIWSQVYEGVKEGDYVFIQFGHNDEKIEKPAVGTTIDEYKANLVKFVSSVREKKATPILLTPIARRSFVNGQLEQTHKGYPAAVKEVADSLQVTFIDLTKQTSDLLVKEGEEHSVALFLHLAEGHANYSKGVKDNTHLNDYGAEVVANLVVDDIRVQKLPLAKYLKE